MEAKQKNFDLISTLLINVSLKKNDDSAFSIEELKGLCKTANCNVIDVINQNVKEINSAFYMGTGKIQEIKQIIIDNDIQLVVFNNELSGSQIRNISEELGVRVIDRTTLILDIFAGRATTNEGKLQVELAQLKYNLPRINGVSQSTNKFGAGVGSRGPGEKQIEIDKRVIQNNIVKLERELEKLKQQRAVKNKDRKANCDKKVAIVGYTNAGKSTLLNLLTKASVYADNKLFATLETTSRKLWLGENKSIVLTDTVGFIDKLPHAFVDAFASTLDEAKDANLLLHVIDLSDKNLTIHKKVVEDVLKQIGADKIEKIIVYNKSDCSSVSDEELEDGIKISAKKGYNIENLKQEIINKLF